MSAAADDLTAVHQRLARLEADNVELREAISAARARRKQARSGPGEHEHERERERASLVDGPVSRRAMLTGTAVAVAGAVVVAGGVDAAPAAAADNGAMKLGQVNAATKTTGIYSTGTGGLSLIQGGGSGTGASESAIAGNSKVSSGVIGASRGGVYPGVQGKGGSNTPGLSGVSLKAPGVKATSKDQPGARGISANDVGVDGTSDKAEGLGSAGNFTHLQFVSTPGYPFPNSPLDATVDFQAGEMLTDVNFETWVTIDQGLVGQVRSLGGARTVGALHLLPVPVRIYDSRPGFAPSVGPKAPLAAGSAIALDLTQNGSGVPKGALAAQLTVLVVDATAGNGNLTVWTNGQPQPTSNSLVWGGTSGRATASVITAIDANAKCQVVSSIKTNIVVDVVGYYL